MNVADVSSLLDHLYFVRDRVLDATARTPTALAATAHPTVRSLHATLVHELDVEWSWRQLLTSPDPVAFDDTAELTIEDLPDLVAIRGRWSRDETEMRAWIARLGDDGLAGPCRAEDPSEHPMWFHLLHVYSHAIQQFSDAAVLLSVAGQSPGGLDFLDSLDRREDRPA